MGIPATGAGAILADLPDRLWSGLMELLRRAFDDLERAHVPRRLRPFVGWHPERLDNGRVRAAVVEVLPGDARLRAALGEQAAAAAPGLSGADIDIARVDADTDPSVVAAALIGAGRWDALAVLAAREAEADHRRAIGGAAEASAGPETPAEIRGDDTRGKAPAARRREDRETRRLEREIRHEQRRVEVLSRELAQARDRVAALERERDDLAAALEDERAAHRTRLARLRRQAHEARRDAADSRRRVEELAASLHDMIDALLAPADRDDDGEAADDVGPHEAEKSERAMPRGIPAADAGRPCLLPPGVRRDTVAAVDALLGVDDLDVLIDGYNVTKDLRGRPAASLPQQRAWLLRTVAGMAATRGVRPTIVFDGQDGTAAGGPSARGVRTVFTRAGEIADDRIKEYVAAMDPGTAVLVVTSDRDLAEAVRALGGNVVSAGVFLRAIGASS